MQLVQGQFYPKADVWANEYDPIHVLLRAVHRRDYQSSMDRFAQLLVKFINKSLEL